MSVTISDLQSTIGDVNRANGWHGDDITPVERLALVMGEASEAIEEIRAGHAVDETYYPRGPWFVRLREWLGRIFCGREPKPAKPEGVPSEVADVVIRCLDFADYYGIDLEAMIAEKVAYNATRGYRHGGKTL